MTLDKVIIDYEKMSTHQEWLMKQNINHGGSEYTKMAKTNKKKAEEHRQLAEWLKELKQTRQTIDDIKADILHLREETYKVLGNHIGFERIITYDKCLEIIDKHMNGKENE